jgi:hypothetical protein
MTAHEQLNIAQAAQMSGLSASTLKRRITANQLTARYSSTGTWLIERSDLMAFLAAHEPSKNGPQRSPRAGASVQEPPRPAHDPSMVDHLNAALVRERSRADDLQKLNNELISQNRELQGDVRKLEAELRALLRREGGGILSRWILSKK